MYVIFLLGTLATGTLQATHSPQDESRTAIELSREHQEAANRLRRIIFQDAVPSSGMPFWEGVRPDQIDDAVNFYMSRLDEKPNQIDSVWYEWGEGNIAQWPSKVLPAAREVFPELWEAGLDPVKLLLEAAKGRGREVFFSYRINGSDNAVGDFMPPMKSDHPEWLLQLWHPFWNFEFQEVRDHKVRVVREVAENYDFDGISIDFARIPTVFPAGQQWKLRHLLTDFMRQVRVSLLQVERRRGRPFLLAARVPENLMGCHFDGLDVEAWARQRIVDIFVVGVRSSNVDIADFRRITSGTGIKIYPSFDDHHSSDGYHEPSIRVWRGVAANWWRQGVDGIHTFNLIFPSPKVAAALNFTGGYSSRPERWERQRQVFRDIGSRETLRGKDKIFYVERRGGGHGPTVFPNPEDWSTPRHMYFNTNMFAPLPVPLDDEGKADTLLTLYVGDDVASAPGGVDAMTLRLLLSDPVAKDLPSHRRLETTLVAVFGHGLSTLKNLPAARGIEKDIEVRVNNLLLKEARVEGGWLVFDVDPLQFAVGDNLVGVRVKGRRPDLRDQLIIEKLELHVDYH